MMSLNMMKEMAKRMPDTGVQLTLLTDEARKQYGIGNKINGVLVSSVEKDCEAHDLGIAPGDVVTFVQDTAVATPGDVQSAIRKAYEEHRPYLAVLLQNRGGARWVSLSMGGISP